jgi:hypothetical protein
VRVGDDRQEAIPELVTFSFFTPYFFCYCAAKQATLPQKNGKTMPL